MTSTQESRAMQLTFDPSFCKATQFNMEGAYSVCSRETKYKCIKCNTSVCALCAPETAQTVNEVNYYPMRRIGICKNCQGRIEEHLCHASVDLVSSKPDPGIQGAGLRKPSGSANQTSSSAEVTQTRQGGQPNQQFLDSCTKKSKTRQRQRESLKHGTKLN